MLKLALEDAMQITKMQVVKKSEGLIGSVLWVLSLLLLECIAVYPYDTTQETLVQ
jgi:hypothetical protein